MKVLIDNSNNDAVYISDSIEYMGNAAAASDSEGNIILILGDMTPANSRIEIIDEAPCDFCGRNYALSDGKLVKKHQL